MVSMGTDKPRYSTVYACLPSAPPSDVLLAYTQVVLRSGREAFQVFLRQILTQTTAETRGLLAKDSMEVILSVS